MLIINQSCLWNVIVLIWFATRFRNFENVFDMVICEMMCKDNPHRGTLWEITRMDKRSFNSVCGLAKEMHVARHHPPSVPTPGLGSSTFPLVSRSGVATPTNLSTEYPTSYSDFMAFQSLGYGHHRSYFYPFEQRSSLHLRRYGLFLQVVRSFCA